MYHRCITARAAAASSTRLTAQPRGIGVGAFVLMGAPGIEPSESVRR
jgi:hypothetical protein